MKCRFENIVTVSTLISNPFFLDGTHCIEYRRVAPLSEHDVQDAYWIRQIACCTEPSRMLVQRGRRFKSTTIDPWPRWRAFAGSGVDSAGFYGSCSLDIDTLLAPGTLIPLAATDRVPHMEKTR